jgi:anti-anti-sigma factor
MPLTVTTAPLKTLGYVVKLSGSLDTNTFTQLDNELQRLANEAAPLVVIDLKELNYISSAGIRILQKAIRALGKNGGMMKLINPQPQVAKVFAVIKVLPMPLDQMFSSEAELDAYLAGIQRGSGKSGAT